MGVVVGAVHANDTCLLPGVALRFVGAGKVLTISEILAPCERLPDVPDTVTANVPAAAVESAVRVRMLKPPPVTGFALNAAVTPLGRPEAASETTPEGPFI